MGSSKSRLCGLLAVGYVFLDRVDECQHPSEEQETTQATWLVMEQVCGLCAVGLKRDSEWPTCLSWPASLGV